MFDADDLLRKLVFGVIILWGIAAMLSLQGCMDNTIWYPDPNDPLRDDGYIAIDYSGEHATTGTVEYYDGTTHTWIRIREGQTTYPLPNAISVDLEIEKLQNDDEKVTVTLFSVRKPVKKITFTDKKNSFRWEATND